MFSSPIKNQLAFWLIVVSVMVRLFAPGAVIDLFWNYDTLERGSILGKIHPGTYMLAFTALMVSSQRQEEGGQVYFFSAVSLAFVVVACTGVGLTVGNTDALGFLIDGELAAAFLCFALAKLPESDRQATLPIVLGGMTLQCLICFGEWATHFRIVPYKFGDATGETVFRPTGLLGHPLTNGLYIAASLPFLMLLRLPLFVRYGLVGVFAAAVFAAETRFSTLVAIPTGLLVYLISTRSRSVSRTEETARFLQIVMGATLAPLVLVVGLAGGFGERLASGLVDQSSEARLSVYSLLKYFTPHEMLFGVGSARGSLILAARQNLVIESPVVELIFLVGAPLMVLFLGVLVWRLFRLAQGATLLVWLGLIAFMIIASANNGLISKTPELIFIIMLVTGSRRREVSAAVSQPSLAMSPLLTPVRGALTVAQRRARWEQRLQRRF